MSKAIQLLNDLTAATKSSRTGLEAYGRLKRHPNFSSPRITSTRPSSSRGVTFHFAHKTISKRSDISDSQRDATSASSHQAYIERLEAVEMSSESQSKIAEKSGLLSPGKHPIHSDFSYPSLTIEPGRDSFGTNGKTKADRVDFWRHVEASEGRTSRVQSRIIAELPHEVTQKERLEIAMRFCSELAKEGLPFWATIHSPTKRNDRRNYHLHVAYFDRPAATDSIGRWDFSITEIRKKKNRTKITARPYKQNKSERTRDRHWVKFLRSQFAEANNKVLSDGGYQKRLDPRSYAESGIRKEPTEHLGFKSNAAEKFGLETTRGTRNSQKEYRWRLHVATQKWDEKIADHDAFLISHPEVHDDASWVHEKDTKKKLQAGRQDALTSVQYTILSEVLTDRLLVRKSFLSQERTRLESNEKLRGAPENQNAISIISIEENLIESRSPELIAMAEECLKKSGELREKSEATWAVIGKPIKSTTLAHEDEIFGGELLYPVEEIFETKTEVHDAVDHTGIPSNIDDIFGPETGGSDLPQNADEATPSEASGVTNDNISPSKEASIPGTLLIPELNTRAELRGLNERLQAMTNREVRMRAITSRDAAEFLEPGEEKFQAKRGWIVLKSEAEMRGIDLVTGKQDLSKATNKERAELHRDEILESIIEVREEVIRVMSR